jgi:thiol:disulfide interchange protein DsbD
MGAEKRAKAAITGPDKAVAGKSFDLVVSIDIQPGYHIQANNAKDPYIPTKVTVTAPEGFKIGTPVYPESKLIDSFGEKLLVFEGKISVKVPITPPATAKGSQEMGVKIAYQACNDTACDPPADTTAFAEVTITPGSATPPAKKPSPAKRAAPVKKKPGSR